MEDLGCIIVYALFLLTSLVVLLFLFCCWNYNMFYCRDQTERLCMRCFNEATQPSPLERQRRDSSVDTQTPRLTETSGRILSDPPTYRSYGSRNPVQPISPRYNLLAHMIQRSSASRLPVVALYSHDERILNIRDLLPEGHRSSLPSLVDVLRPGSEDTGEGRFSRDSLGSASQSASCSPRLLGPLSNKNKSTTRQCSSLISGSEIQLVMGGGADLDEYVVIPHASTVAPKSNIKRPTARGSEQDEWTPLLVKPESSVGRTELRTTDVSELLELAAGGVDIEQPQTLSASTSFELETVSHVGKKQCSSPKGQLSSSHSVTMESDHQPSEDAFGDTKPCLLALQTHQLRRRNLPSSEGGRADSVSSQLNDGSQIPGSHDPRSTSEYNAAAEKPDIATGSTESLPVVKDKPQDEPRYQQGRRRHSYTSSIMLNLCVDKPTAATPENVAAVGRPQRRSRQTAMGQESAASGVTSFTEPGDTQQSKLQRQVADGRTCQQDARQSPLLATATRNQGGDGSSATFAAGNPALSPSTQHLEESLEQNTEDESDEVKTNSIQDEEAFI